ncbi:MAG: hypothetical protein ACR2PZ_18185 [Pseudomonadales bacterium]
MAVIRTALLVLIGAIPATILCWFLGTAVISGFVAYFAPSNFYWPAIALGSLAEIYATYALWNAAFGVTDRWVEIGLAAGLVAAIPIVRHLTWADDPFLPGNLRYIAIGPIVAAIYVLVEIANKRRARQT